MDMQYLYKMGHYFLDIQYYPQDFLDMQQSGLDMRSLFKLKNEKYRHDKVLPLFRDEDSNPGPTGNSGYI